MSKKDSYQITSFSNFKTRARDLIKDRQNDTEFTKLVLANPILALERAGLTFSAEARKDITKRLRADLSAPPADKKALKKIEAADLSDGKRTIRITGIKLTIKDS